MRIKHLYNKKTGKLLSHTFPGFYPIIYTTGQGEDVCPDCANELLQEEDKDFRPKWGDVYFEGLPLQCEKCGTYIESAYGDPEDNLEDSLDEDNEND